VNHITDLLRSIENPEDLHKVITEVRLKTIDDGGHDVSGSEKLLAFCSITILDMFVIRDLKIIDSSSGPFVAMPSRKLTGRCRSCGSKNHIRANYCNECGRELPPYPVDDPDGRNRLHADIAHPINAESRSIMEDVVLTEYERAVDASLSGRRRSGRYAKYDDN
jgi:stage V sporulation protein G